MKRPPVYELVTFHEAKSLISLSNFGTALAIFTPVPSTKLTILGLFWLLTSTAFGRVYPWQCEDPFAIPYQVKGTVVKVSTGASYVSLQLKVSRKVNLCTGERISGKTELLSFGGEARFIDPIGLALSPTELASGDSITAVGTAGPVVFPASCEDRNRCYLRGIVLHQRQHKLYRR